MFVLNRAIQSAKPVGRRQLARVLVALGVFIVTLLPRLTEAQAGTATNNLTVSITINAGCTINASTLAFTAVAGTTIATTAQTNSTTVSVTCTNGSPFSIGMGNGNNYTTTRQMANGTNYIGYGLFTDSGYANAWTTATNSTFNEKGKLILINIFHITSSIN